MTPGFFWLQHPAAWGYKEHKGLGCSGQAVLAVKGLPKASPLATSTWE